MSLGKTSIMSLVTDCTGNFVAALVNHKLSDSSVEFAKIEARVISSSVFSLLAEILLKLNLFLFDVVGGVGTADISSTEKSYSTR